MTRDGDGNGEGRKEGGTHKPLPTYYNIDFPSQSGGVSGGGTAKVWKRQTYFNYAPIFRSNNALCILNHY